MRTVAIITFLALCGCTTTTTTTMRGKEVVKVEKSGSYLFDFLGVVFGTALAGTASHYLDQGRGFRK